MPHFDKGGFTMPGEAGYEALTLQLAKRWGADVIRDSDGTELSPELVSAGYGVYSTICIIRGHNKWAGKHPDCLQQTFLCTQVTVAESDTLIIPLMDGYFKEQFAVNGTMDALRYWQVWDRTENKPLPSDMWRYDGKSSVVITGALPYHGYTVSFLAWRIWEEISMYNQTTNNWTQEHLCPIDPVYTETRNYLSKWMREWCEAHPATTVVRFTSLFYNFVWIWDENAKTRFCDWASYDFTVSPRMLDGFAYTKGYSLTAEDFINGGKLNATHRPPTKQKLDYIDYVSDFVLGFGKELVEIAHEYGKQAYLFYDDSWVGTEPYGKRFEEYGFDGLIKCVFSGYEARLCAGVNVPTHELRLHPYLFPVGLGGAPTFMEGGDPAADALRYWTQVRRALLRQPVDRIGLGGYPHLTEGFPGFIDCIEGIAREFRQISALHEEGLPYVLPCRVGVLHGWGRLRSWSLSGHFHETDAFDLIHINEALSGLPVDVSFLSFEDAMNGELEGLDILINAGPAGTVWSGGDAWRDPVLVEAITQWVWKGGVLIGVGEPSAVKGFDSFLRLSCILGVDVDDGERVCHGRRSFEVHSVNNLISSGTDFKAKRDVLLSSADTMVLFESEGFPVLTESRCGKGRGFYLSGFRYSNAAARTLLNLISYATGLTPQFLTSNTNCESAWFPVSRKLAIINNSRLPQTVSVIDGAGEITLNAFEMRIIPVEHL